jgi:kynureninase
MKFEPTLASARQFDKSDELSKFRSLFHFPKSASNEEVLYFTGNSLGLQPLSTKHEVQQVIDNWKNLAVKGHFQGTDPWIEYNDKLKPSMARIVGALPTEVAIMNTLTVNLHLLMISFYRPTSSRFKVLMEADAFPSDRYAIDSHVKSRGHNPDDSVILMGARNGEQLLREEDILDLIDEKGDEIALVLFGGINYYTGQVLPMAQITEKAHEKGCMVGFDLAHCAGNIPLSLHGWNVDFAAWCNYKYLNSGPGSIASIFVHEKHHASKDIERLEGWWGNALKTRFLMADTFDPSPGAEAWVMSTPPTLAIAPIRASLELFDEAGMEALRSKSLRLTGFLEYLIHNMNDPRIEIITPSDPNQRGCQLSLRVVSATRSLYEQLISNGVVVDWREPDVIRIAPAPMYNSFEDVFRFYAMLKSLLK